ncbi:response regulator transcription factor [Thalassomonas viridans]|uniref:Response regulator transcription factor n=1 Tax=Thalassomonas viridans TaxID=137584 RepID=A0AAE9YXG9_9GAMM|nr:response regulator [Thalassomonas viridans]WDE03026.1 response regulator transcription factor [Thalassomonas viridans]
MAKSQPRILIIDDDREYLELLTEALEADFVVKCAHNLSMAEMLISDLSPIDIALVDEHIADEKGSGWIKQQTRGESPVKSFVLYSGMATEEAILSGLECGADDFLCKPISLLALKNKLTKLIAYQHKIKDFEAELHSKDKVITISMAQASKYGACMQLSSRLNHCESYEAIRDEVFHYFYNMNLHGCLAFYPLNESAIFYHSQKGCCSPVEVEVMEILKAKPRLYRFGPRTIFNHALVSILILNLEEDHIDTDIYIDALASVIECIGARMEFITYKGSLTQVEQQIQEAVFKTKKMLGISKLHQQEVMAEIVQNIGMSFHVLDLSEEQESYLTALVHSALKKHTQDDINFMEVSNLLDQALASVDKLQALNTGQKLPGLSDEEDELF